MTPLVAGAPVLADGWWPTVSLIVFMALFVGIVIYVFVVPKSAWNRDSRIPLDDPRKAGDSKESSRD
jgi:hypothetical protein